MKLKFPFFGQRAILTLEGFLTNPTGKSTSMMASRKRIKDNLDNHYYKLLKKHKDFKYVVYIDSYAYLFHFKIPSETFDELYYDVVLEFLPHEKKMQGFSTINDYSINFFSNSPDMMFTYDYVLKENDIYIPFLQNAGKYSSKAMKTRPKTRNPVELFGFEKSCYYAAMYISTHKLTTKKMLDKVGIKSNKLVSTKFLNSVMSQELKLNEYNKFKKLEQEKKRKEREANRKKKEAENKKNNKRVGPIQRNKKKSGFKSTTARHKAFKGVVKK
jgi:hypothetical protein